MEDKVLYIVRGIPGSGKSSFAKELVGDAHLVCEADNYHINKVTGHYEWEAANVPKGHEYCRNLVETYMKDSLLNDQFYRRIAVSNTFTQEWEMDSYFELARKYGYKVFSVIVENRHGGRNVHNVPDDILEKMRKRFSIKL